MLEIQKRAIIGYGKEKQFFLKKISQQLDASGKASEIYPPWYEDLSDAVYQENWGLAGIQR